jgi:hypothetical protein
VFVSAGHNIVCEFTRNIIYPKDNIVPLADTKRCGFANDVMLRINDVLPLAKTLLQLCRKYTFARGMLHFLQKLLLFLSKPQARHM